MLDLSWLLFVMWDMRSMCQIWRLRAYAIYRLYVAFLYWLMFLELFNFITCLLFNPIFCLTSPDHHLCNDDQDEIQYYATILYSRATILYCASWFETSCCLCITTLYQANRVPSTDV